MALLDTLKMLYTPERLMEAMKVSTPAGRIEEIASLYEEGIIEQVTAMQLLNTPLQPEPMPCVKDDRRRPADYQCQCDKCLIQRERLAFPESPLLNRLNTAPLPEPTHCTCGAELMGAKAVAWKRCGDCNVAFLSGRKPQDIDTRIRAAAKPDADPTSGWSAGATAGYEWP